MRWVRGLVLTARVLVEWGRGLVDWVELVVV